MKTLASAAAHAEIFERIRKVSPDSPRQWGKMTPHQMLCHLADGYLVAMGTLAPADRSNFLTRTVVRYIALHAPMQWPKGAKTVPELDQFAGAGTPPASFEADRTRLLELVDRFAATRAFAPHPIFAVMTEWEWMRWAYLHADHHLTACV